MTERFTYLFMEPFYGGSHRSFADGLIAHSRHRIELLELPARFWKWRLRSAALYFSEAVRDLNAYDGLILSGMMSLADFIALCRKDCPPALVYFHENQLTYPQPPGGFLDIQLALTNITTALAAQRLFFNSRVHRDAFLDSVSTLLKHIPEFVPHRVGATLNAKAKILYPGCDFSGLQPSPAEPVREDPPLIIWNHRWDFDKNPGEFFTVLDIVAAKGGEFRLALLGENSHAVPKAFIRAKERYGTRIVQYGYVGSRKEYLNWLRRGSIVVSTSRQENFGIAVIEAIRAGCLPLLPDRLAYPEIIPRRYHDDVLYRNRDDLVKKMLERLGDHARRRKMRRELAAAMDRFCWDALIDRYDRALEEMTAEG